MINCVLWKYLGGLPPFSGMMLVTYKEKWCIFRNVMSIIIHYCRWWQMNWIKWCKISRPTKLQAKKCFSFNCDTLFKWYCIHDHKLNKKKKLKIQTNLQVAKCICCLKTNGNGEECWWIGLWNNKFHWSTEKYIQTKQVQKFNL